MKKRINFIGKWGGHTLLYNILKEKYEVEISDDPDYIIVSPLCEPLEYMKYDCVRILFTGEPFTPDFNVFDYAIGFDYMSCLDSGGEDRYYRYPLCFCGDRSIIQKYIYGMSKGEAEKALKQKKYFCNFIYSHHSARGEREELFEAINSYKRVESAGSFLNNMPDAFRVSYNNEKMDFLKLCKFTIAAESIVSPGFITEKIMDPFCNGSIPIYWGNPFVLSEFNDDAFVNCMEYDDIEKVVDRVIEIDNNDELYLSMLTRPKCIDDNYYEEKYRGLKEFIWRIFSENMENAKRRMDFYSAGKYQDALKEGFHYQHLKKSRIYSIYSRLVTRR